MAIAYDSVGTKVDTNSDGTISWVHTMIDNTNAIVVASFAVIAGAQVINASPTYNGTNMTKAITVTNGGLQEHEVWYFLAPPIGLGTIRGTWDFTTSWKGGISVGYTGVDQTTPIIGSVTATGNTTSGSVVRTITANNWWLGQISINFTKPGTTNIGVERGTADSASREFLVADNTSGTIRWTMGGQAFAASGVELGVSGGAPAVVNQSFKALTGAGNI